MNIMCVLICFSIEVVQATSIGADPQITFLIFYKTKYVVVGKFMIAGWRKNVMDKFCMILVPFVNSPISRGDPHCSHFIFVDDPNGIAANASRVKRVGPEVGERFRFLVIDCQCTIFHSYP